MNIAELQDKTNEELMELAREMGVIDNGASPRRHALMMKVLQGLAERNGQVLASGVLSITSDSYGFLKSNGRHAGSGDVYVSQSQIRRFGLRTGDHVTGQVRPPKDGERYFGLIRVEAVNGLEPEASRSRPHFDRLTPIFPNEHIKLETTRQMAATRIIDVASPVGRGQRGLIVSPPKAGKTTLLKNIAEGITTNAPDIHLMVALIGERPEEVTDMMRSVEGEVFSSTFDEPVEDHTRVAELALARAKRLVEAGRDVVILLDSLTRLTRAYNLAVPTSGRTLSGGIDPVALYPPKRFFGAARIAAPGRRGRRQPHHTGRMPRRHRQPDGRSDLRGVQGIPATWRSTSTGSSPSAASSRPSTSAGAAPAARSCCSTRRRCARSGSSGAWSP